MKEQQEVKIPGYPKNGIDTQGNNWVKYPVEITEKFIERWQPRVIVKLKLRHWIGVTVKAAGFDVSPFSVTFNTEAECERACDVHNNWAGYSKKEVTRIVGLSMKNSEARNKV